MKRSSEMSFREKRVQRSEDGEFARSGEEEIESGEERSF